MDDFHFQSFKFLAQMEFIWNGQRYVKMGNENLIKAQKQTETFNWWAKLFNWLLISLPNENFSVHQIDFGEELKKKEEMNARTHAHAHTQRQREKEIHRLSEYDECRQMISLQTFSALHFIRLVRDRFN